MRRALLSFSFVALAAPVLVAVAACSGSSDGPVSPSDSGTSDVADGEPIEGGNRTPTDAGIVVTESPAPTCHDLTHHGSAILTTTSADPAPAQTEPATTILPGLYVLSKSIEYETATTLETAQQITVVVTPSRYYYVGDEDTSHVVVTTAWSISGGKLTRNILCSDQDATAAVEHRIDSDPHGYVIYTSSRQGKTIALTYTKL